MKVFYYEKVEKNDTVKEQVCDLVWQIFAAFMAALSFAIVFYIAGATMTLAAEVLGIFWSAFAALFVADSNEEECVLVEEELDN